MVGAVIVTHSTLGEALLETAEVIVGKIDHVRAVALVGDEKTEALSAKIEAAIKETDSGDGVIVFTDMFGGTPTNVSLSFLSEGEIKVEVLTGVNLPILLRFLNQRDQDAISDLIPILRESGRESIVPASDMLKGG